MGMLFDQDAIWIVGRRYDVCGCVIEGASGTQG